ncbi:hypothetical protein [Arthrobacter sp. AG1021]|uniref:hypothetical protein n=1 Tax=Arthrobacter sp. AG1021 TaxID=2183908 RepID=UPI000EAD3966|nr:hypothetical protein [Arthrobacter sp. AG1021]
MLISSMLYLVAETQSSGGGSSGSPILSAVIGGVFGALITAIISLANNYSTLQAQRRITEQTLEAQSEINELNAGWQAQREADEAERKAEHEHQVWKRTRKETLYSDYLIAVESLSSVKFIGASDESQTEIVEHFDVILRPNLLVIASKPVVDAVLATREAFIGYVDELHKVNNHYFEGEETEETAKLFKIYKKTAKSVSNAMREDLGIEKLYDEKTKKK